FVKIELLEKKQEFIKCLQLFMSGMKISEVYTSKQSLDKIFRRIWEKLVYLELQDQSVAFNAQLFDQLNKEIVSNCQKMIQFDTVKTVTIIDEKITSNHKDLIQSLANEQEIQLQYLEALLKIKEKEIQDIIREYSLYSHNPAEAKKYIEFM